jgi:hypothetical protein
MCTVFGFRLGSAFNSRAVITMPVDVHVAPDCTVEPVGLLVVRP